MQSRVMSFVEAFTNVVVGYGVAVATQMIVFPWFGLRATLGQNLGIGLIFTIISLARSYLLRRLFILAEISRNQSALSAPDGKPWHNLKSFGWRAERS
jgi:hypothetical protein